MAMPETMMACYIKDPHSIAAQSGLIILATNFVKVLVFFFGIAENSRFLGA